MGHGADSESHGQGTKLKTPRRGCSHAELWPGFRPQSGSFAPARKPEIALLHLKFQDALHIGRNEFPVAFDPCDHFDPRDHCGSGRHQVR